MPLSLWFIPREESPFTKTANELISDTIPNIFLSPDKTQPFQPHVTVTSGIDLENSTSPQQWLDSLPVSEYKPEHNEILLELDSLEAEDPFFRKMNIALRENANLSKFNAEVRKQAKLEADGDYRPHLSLLYADVPTADVKAKLPLIEMKVGFAIGDLFACCGGALCLGGYMVLVDTSKEIKDWKVVAKKETPFVVWRVTRNLV